jgi:hypothetical protein
MLLSFLTQDYVHSDWLALPKYSCSTYQLYLSPEIIKDGTIIGNINIKDK